MPDTVLLTAAADGLGYHLAHRLCADGHCAVLVTPVDGELDWIAAELVLCGADVRAIACDLETPNGPQDLFDELAADGVFIDLLVNNAGHARRTGDDLPIRHYLANLRLDVETALRMTALFLPDMLVRGHGHILNVSSAAASGEMSMPPAATRASDAFLLAWTEALAEELAGSPVTVTAFVNPACGRDALAGTGAAPAREAAPLSSPRALADAACDALFARQCGPATDGAVAPARMPAVPALHHNRPRRSTATAQRSLG